MEYFPWKNNPSHDGWPYDMAVIIILGSLFKGLEMKTIVKMSLLGALIIASSGSSGVQAKEVKFMFGLALAPYVIQDSNSGFEVDIIRAALAVKGHTLTPIYASFSLVTENMKANKADGAQRGTADLLEGAGFYYAESQTVMYQDMAISLKKNNLTVNSVNDLKDKIVIAFQGASKFLGPEFGAAVAGNKKYVESANEQRKIKQFYANGMDVFVGDVNIFKYFRKQVTDVDTKQEIVLHKIFPNSDIKTNHAVFKDQQLRDDFDAGLKQLKSSGKYQEIIKKYISE
jgi:polar amino acid transport system substrate-binding protein